MTVTVQKGGAANAAYPSEQLQGTEEMMLDIVKDVKVIKAAILKSRYIAARLANGEMLKLYFAIASSANIHPGFK